MRPYSPSLIFPYHHDIYMARVPQLLEEDAVVYEPVLLSVEMMQDGIEIITSCEYRHSQGTKDIEVTL